MLLTHARDEGQKGTKSTDEPVAALSQLPNKMTQRGSAPSVLSTDSAFSPSQSFCLEAPKPTASVSFPQQPSPPDPATLSSISVCTVVC